MAGKFQINSLYCNGGKSACMPPPVPYPDAAGRSSPAICYAVLLVLYPGRQEFIPITLLPAQNPKQHHTSGYSATPFCITSLPKTRNPEHANTKPEIQNTEFKTLNHA
ncbi:MAG: hypothetical protein ACP5DZ_09205 [Bacteroidales bacterium]